MASTSVGQGDKKKSQGVATLLHTPNVAQQVRVVVSSRCTESSHVSSDMHKTRQAVRDALSVQSSPLSDRLDHDQSFIILQSIFLFNMWRSWPAYFFASLMLFLTHVDHDHTLLFSPPALSDMHVSQANAFLENVLPLLTRMNFDQYLFSCT